MPRRPLTAIPGRSRGERARWGLAALGYGALIFYGSLYPFSGWTTARVTLFAFLASPWPAHLSRADVVTNVLAYIPLGLLLARWWRKGGARLGAIVVPTLLGALLSLAMEFTQQFLPARVASVSDLLANALGSLVGALLAGVILPQSLPWAILMRRRNLWFGSGRLVDLGLVAIGLWALSQLTPLVPSLDLGNLRHGLAPIWQTLQHPERFNFTQWATYEFYVAGLALLALTLAAPGQRVFARFFGFVACLLVLKIAIVTRQLSLEAVTGALAALVLALPFRSLRPATVAGVSALFIVGGFTIAELASAPSGATQPFNWVPFVGQMENPLIGIASILEDLWPAAALAYLARYACPAHLGRVVAAAGALALALLAFGLEWYQQYLPGRYGDFTVVLLATGTWLVFWSTPVTAAGIDTAEIGAPKAAPVRRKRPTWRIAGTLGLAATTGLAALVLGQRAVEVRVDESRLPQLPAPEQLPPVDLPRFKYAHPRLPSPSAADLAAISSRNPQFLREARARAAGGRGNFDAAALQELVEPGSVDLNVLHGRLMALKFSFRGHDQGKPLALAYDWLYDHWSDAQRVQLRGKLADGCDYLIERIRKERMSPYNVILYNAPFQALMACSLALYGDDPRGEPIMRFSYDLWKNRVLPSWRQIMGRNGGWHEGGEYVGIGIGQAIYQVPAMWRSATGEDLFASEPGIRGFLDFLVYHTRPDGTDYRWGDGGWFDKIVPDALPLALEFRHAPAYSMHPGGDLAPAGWPWGPLNDTSLNDPTSFARLPLARQFDGIGMLVARSDWSPSATYVTFKAGDNHWSHMHLDQGAFTIYKGGELAIDSGLYGPSYGDDHHMNYSYQSIAHNIVTVTDPKDTVPAPGKEQPRSIANDGGQRRVGSGWGVEAAPLDRAEWEAKREIYHTATMGPLLDQDGLAVVAADITPAYTNAASGSGTFSARTRRVERFWRVFGYDRIDDVVVVFDQVTATNASFRKRWLLHTLDAPSISSDGFRVAVAPQERPGHGGGRLEGRVLLPKQAVINAVGGRGLEFLVDDKNYDENGTLQELIRKLGPNRGEPGKWRIEVSPPQDATDDQFLVVLLPTAGSSTPNHRVRLLESGKRVGCEVVGPNRTVRWWFEPGRNHAEIEVLAGSDSHRYQVSGPEAPPPGRSDWLTRMRSLFRAGAGERSL
jgi:VanZ family protein